MCRPRLHKNLFLIREKQKHQDLSKRRLPGLAGRRLSEGVPLTRLSSNCFETGREHTLNLLRRLLSARGSKWMSGPARMQGSSAARQSCATNDFDQPQCALSTARPKTSSFSLDTRLTWMSPTRKLSKRQPYESPYASGVKEKAIQ